MAQMIGDPVLNPPSDGITRLLYSQSSPTLLAASWDQTLRLYNTIDRNCMTTLKQRTPILDAAYPDDATAYCGLLSGEIRRIMTHTGQDVMMGRHDAAVRCMEWCKTRQYLITGSWDQTMKIWDPRSMQPLVKAISLPGRVFAMSTAGDTLVVGLSKRVVMLYDVRKLEYGQEEAKRESSLKYMTRSVCVRPDGQGYAVGSVEGRVAMEMVDPRPEVQQQKYAFKCHRRTEEGKEIVYPVHSITYNQAYGTFATGAGDGVVNFWDGDNKKRLFQISRYPTSVSALAFSPDGRQLAVASSYAWEEGERSDVPAPAIFLRPVADAEIRPKTRPPAPA